MQGRGILSLLCPCLMTEGEGIATSGKVVQHPLSYLSNQYKYTFADR